MPARPALPAVSLAVSLLLAACEAPPHAPPPSYLPSEHGFTGAATGTADPDYPLGLGYDTVTQTFRERCVELGAGSYPYPVAYLGGGAYSDATRALGFVLRRDALDVLGPRARAHLARAGLASPRLSTGTLFVFVGTKRLEQFTVMLDPTWHVPPEAPDFWARCGDRFVRGRTLGFGLLVMERIDFATAADREAWVEEDRAGRWSASVEGAATLERGERFAGRAAVHVEVVQRGGDLGRLAEVLHGDGPAAGYALDCPVERPGPCGAALLAAGAYLSDDGPGGFGAAAAEGGAVAELVLGWYDEFLLDPPAPLVGAEVVDARLALASAAKAQAALLERVGALERGLLRIPATLAARLPALRRAVDGNVAALRAAFEACWDRLGDPADGARAACLEAASAEGLATAGYDASLAADDLQ